MRPGENKLNMYLSIETRLVPGYLKKCRRGFPKLHLDEGGVEKNTTFHLDTFRSNKEQLLGLPKVARIKTVRF